MKMNCVEQKVGVVKKGAENGWTMRGQRAAGDLLFIFFIL